MKKLLLILILSFSINTFGQTQVDLSGLTGNITLGQDCSSTEIPEYFETTGDCNLNGYKITLRNSVLKVNGNINGNGRIDNCGNSNSQICALGVVQNSPIFDGITLVNCNTLSTTEFDIHKDYGYNYKVYNTTGMLLSKGKTSIDLYNILPKNTVLLLVVEGFKVEKLILQ